MLGEILYSKRCKTLSGLSKLIIPIPTATRGVIALICTYLPASPASNSSIKQSSTDGRLRLISENLN